jgi:hypothetical protein
MDCEILIKLSRLLSKEIILLNEVIIFYFLRNYY